MRAERWSDGPPLFPDLPFLLGVVDLLLGSTLEEKKRKSDSGMAPRTWPLSV